MTINLTSMKKMMLGLALATLPTLTFAQGGFQFGVKGGVNLSRLTFGQFVNTGLNANGSPAVDVNGQTLRNNISDSYNSRTGISLGVYTRFGKNLFIQPELMYTTREGQFDVVRNGVNETVTIKSSSFDVPVLLGLKGGPLRVMAGPIASFRIENNAGISDALKQYTTGSLNDAWAKAWYGYQVGGGLDLGNVGIDVRYEGNLTDVARVETSGGTFSQRAKSWQVTLAYRIF